MVRSNGASRFPGRQAHALAEHYPGLRLRSEPAHREAFVALPAGPGGVTAVHFELVTETSVGCS
jgi:hypothetical protein